MFASRRRIVTGRDAEGRSVVVSDGPPSSTVELGGAGLGEIWAVPAVPVDPGRAEDGVSDAPPRLDPPAGGVKIRWFVIGPEGDGPPAEEAAAAAFAAIGAPDARVDVSRHPMMHETATIDAIILISGRITMLLEADERDLEPGDVVIQRGTNHAWVNRGTEPALLVAVLMSAEAAEG